jgi:hypothetical protein
MNTGKVLESSRQNTGITSVSKLLNQQNTLTGRVSVKTYKTTIHPASYLKTIKLVKSGPATRMAVTATRGKKWANGSKRFMSLGAGLLMSNATLMDAQKPLRVGAPTLTVGNTT